jgi:Rrf2 family nitric oxide-sensitive transcriptional repressor
MKLTSHTDYGLRVLMALAVMDDRLVTIEELATRHRVSRNHLMKVAQTLVGLGFVRSVRGRSGGLKLARDPADIRMGAVVRAMEEQVRLVACLGEGPVTCALTGSCRLTRALGRALDAFFAELDGLTLADLVANRPELRARLGVGSETTGPG